MSQAILSFLVFWPFVLAMLVLLVPADMTRLLRALLISGMVILAAGIAMAVGRFDPGLAHDQTWMGYQLLEKRDWISLNLQAFGRLSIDYLVGVDGISLSFLVLSGLVLLVASVASAGIGERVKGYVICFLIMAGSLMGCFVALDFFLFFIFFEFMLIPLFFLIGLWGGERREYAAVKFFLYTVAGSVFILMALIALYMSTIDPVETAIQFGLMNPGDMLTTEMVFEIQQLLAGGGIPAEQIVHTFTFPYLADESNLIPWSVLSFESESSFAGLSLRTWGFGLLLLGFLIKLPAVPVHTWLPDAHVEAPTAVSVVLAALVLKVGAYGLFRIVWPVFPDQVVEHALPIALIGLVSVLYGGLNALGSTDLKRMVAYSSVSQMGFVLLGLASLTPEGLAGAVFQSISHGLTSAFLFLIAGVIYDRTRNRNRDDLAGLAGPMPVWVSLAMVGFFASMGIPGFSGFVGEFLVLVGAFTSAGFNQYLPRWVGLAATSGLILSAAYYLYTARKMFFGELWVRKPEWIPALRDLTLREYLTLLPLLCAFTALGLFPGLLLGYLNPALEHLRNLVQLR